MARTSGSLRTRFMVACALLVATGAVSSFWTLAALSRLREAAAVTVHQSDRITGATTRVASALEREDDALLLTVAGDQQGPAALARERGLTDSAVAQLVDVDGTAASARLRQSVVAYRTAVDETAGLSAERDVLLHYHRTVNPLLRHAIAVIAEVRDRHFGQSQRAAAAAQDEVRRARGAVLGIAIVALSISVLVALRLARVVVRPLEELRRTAQAIQCGDLDARARITGRDEFGEVAAAFNAMAMSLAEFRRSNLDEVLQAKATLEATLEALPDAVVLVEPDGAIAALNAEAKALLRDAGIVEPRRIEDLAPVGLEGQRVEEAMTGRLPPAALVLHAAVPVQRGGETRRLLPRLLRTRGTDEGRARVVIVISDLTDLVRLDEMRAEMIAVASHELRTPVTTMRMTLLMLREAAAELTPRLRELVDTAAVGVHQLMETVNELLDLTRIEAGRLKLSREPVDVAALVRESLQAWAGRATDAGIRLDAHLDVVPPILADRVRLRAVLDNLVDNALKYAPAASAVGVHLVASTAKVAIVVEDVGPGIPEDYRERVFDKFFRVEHHRQQGRDPRGSGIGLYLCRQLVELHGGTIHCEPRRPLGTRIVVELPLEPPAG